MHGIFYFFPGAILLFHIAIYSSILYMGREILCSEIHLKGVVQWFIELRG